MQIEMKRWQDLKPYENNPRVNDHAVAAVAESIQRYGFRQPIVVDPDNTIIIGHTRWRAAQSLNLDVVPVHTADLPPDKARALRLVDNQTASLADWNDDLLRSELAALEAAGYMVSELQSLGFDDDQLASLTSPPNYGVVDPDEVPEPPTEAVTKVGDLWLLGKHKLLCGDSTKAADVDRVMNGEKAALIATDPPYLVDYTGERPNNSGKDWTADYKEIDIEDADAFFRSVFTHIKRVAAPKAALYCWHAHKRVGLIQRVWEDLGILDHQAIVWIKPTAVFGRCFWHFRHEPCMMGWVQGSKPEHDGKHTMEMNSVWELGWEGGRSRVSDNQHPTQKPVELFARPMRKHTKPGQVCFEPFSGSGSQIIAGEQEGRRVYAIELSPVFVDVAVRRWEQFTGQKAELEGGAS